MENSPRSTIPHSLGSALAGEYAGSWGWRIVHYSLVGRIEDERVLILVMRVAHRRKVYR